jgi:hypothetical protein
MYQRQIAFLCLLASAVFTVACGPTDISISTKVRTNLTADETVKTAGIDVGVQNRVVTLSGTVDTAVVKEQAVAVANGRGHRCCRPAHRQEADLPSWPWLRSRTDGQENEDGRQGSP